MNFLKDITWTEIFIFAHTCAALICMLRVLYKQKKHRFNLCLAETFAKKPFLRQPKSKHRFSAVREKEFCKGLGLEVTLNLKKNLHLNQLAV
ncbi:Uncharacterised protein [Neisseria subflava]|nr:Uncharacterised protein [Neisseria subflava]